MAVAAPVESVSVGAATPGRDRGDAAQVRQRSLGGDSSGVVAGTGEESAGDLGTDTALGEQVGCHLGDRVGDLAVGVCDLLAELVAALPAGSTDRSDDCRTHAVVDGWRLQTAKWSMAATSAAKTCGPTCPSSGMICRSAAGQARDNSQAFWAGVTRS
jgi:hypothetical protein